MNMRQARTAIAGILEAASRVQDTRDIPEPHFERIATTHGLTIDADDTHKFIVLDGVTLRARLVTL